MQMKMEIRNIKSIKHFVFDIPLRKGLYALTGENGCGKSTIVTCAATSFFDLRMMEYFGKPIDSSSISIDFDEKKRLIYSKNSQWFGPIMVVWVLQVFLKEA